MEKELVVKNEEETKEIVVSENVEKLKFLFPELKQFPNEEIAKAFLISTKVYKLNPLKNECHFVPFTDKKTGEIRLKIITSYLIYLKKASQSGKLNGFNIEIKQDTDKSIYAEATIYRKDWQYPFKWRTYLREVKKATRIWDEMTRFMLMKVCLAQAFRIAFPEDVGELPYTQEEFEIKEDMPATKINEIAEIVVEKEEMEEDYSFDEQEQEQEQKQEQEQENEFQIDTKEKITDRQIQMLHILLNRKPLSEFLDKFSLILGRKVKGVFDLTKEEASILIDHFKKKVENKKKNGGEENGSERNGNE
ncbi:MAG: recombinase RecT [bacterium]